ncbi:MAG: DUF1566 domain-containing protein [Proteobacteria bacterium]|nr:DUF1566 domain-containing protein [Pseudomonadota bacterium]
MTKNKWRLPTRQELESLLDLNNYNPALPKNHPFINVQSNYYWSSSSYAGNTNGAWVVGMGSGYVGSSSKTYGNRYVWPVRSGQCGTLGDLVISRFTDNREAITDNRTGLEWMKNANVADRTMPWQEALDYVEGLNKNKTRNMRKKRRNEIK